MKYLDNEYGEVSIDFSFKFSKRREPRLTTVIFCDGDAEWVLKGEKKVKRIGSAIKFLDVLIQCPGNRTRLSKERSRELWGFFQMNGFLL